MSWGQIWTWLSDPENQKTLGWLGGGVVVIAGGAWTAYLHVSKRGSPAAAAGSSGKSTFENVTASASGSGVAVVASGDVTINRDPMVERAFDVLKQQLTAAQVRKQEFQDTIRALHQAIAAIHKQTDLPDAIRALELAAQGQTEAAEALFLEAEQRKVEEGRAAYKEAAEAARHRTLDHMAARVGGRPYPKA